MRLRAAERVAAYTQIALWWALSRALVLASVFVVQALGWPRPSWYPSLREHPFALLEAWDGRWYRMVAESGYLVVPGHQSDVAFFPLFPVAMNALGVLGMPLGAAGLLLANLGLLVGLVALYELARTWVAEEEARRTAVYAALFPAGFVFSMLYPEGIALAAFALAGLFAVRRRWLACAAAAAVATLARPEGIVLFLPIAAAVLRVWPSLPETARPRALAAAAAAPAALATLVAYHWRMFGDPLAFSSAQRAWGRELTVDGLWRAVAEVANPETFMVEWLYRDVAFAAVYLACLVLALRVGVPRTWVAGGALIVLLPLQTGSFTSATRFGLLALPVYCGLATLGRRAWADVAIRSVCAAGLVAGSATILLRWP